ncbi:MAG: DNRLRE domain-containing protein [Anaerolineae bacterium]
MMNSKICRYLLRFSVFALCGLTVMTTLVTPASSRSAAPQQTTAFLSAPYYGSTRLSSIFDHDVQPNHILAFTGAAAHRDNCPCPPGRNCVHPTFGTAYYSCDINDYLYYDDHNGVDYVLRYAYVRAAAPGTVARADWANVNHQASYGLHVRIDHDINGDRITDYQTIYGHMSVLRVQMGDEIPASADEFTHIVGISGNTGWSSGPHLHFEVRNAAGAAVDPYGPDRNPDHKLWIERPSIDPHVIYTSGDRPLTAPPIVENESGYVTVDDGSTNYSETPGCWTVDNTAGWAGDHRYRDVPDGNCTATWNFPSSQSPGYYNVFAYVPSIHATTDAAQYTIRHTESPSRPWSKQTAWAAVNQLVYPNDYHPSSWVYVGTYYFNDQYGTDYVRLESQPLDPVGTARMAADAVRFAPVVYRTYLPLVMKRWPPIPDTPVLNSIYNPDNDGNYTVSWQAAYLADTYILQEATNASFVGAVTRYFGTGTSWSAIDKAVDTYYYRVKARNSWGDSGWSNVQQTSVLPPPTWFYAVADTMVAEGYPNSNWGTSEDMWAGYDASLNPDGKRVRALVRFDLSAIPSGTPINQATLWLYLRRSYDVPDQWRTITTYRATASWAERGVTWNTRPYYSGAYGSASIKHATWGWYTFDVTGLARAWVNGSYSNYGIIVRGPESSADPNWRGFCTREHTQGCGAWLQITYSGTMGALAPPEAPNAMPETFRSPLPVPESPDAMPEIFRSPLPVPEP